MKVYQQWCWGYFCIPLNGLPVCNFLHVPSTVKIPLFVLSIGYWWQVQSYLRSTITFSCPTLCLKHGSQSEKINNYCGFHDNDALADMAVLVHPKERHICTQNIRGGQKCFMSNFVPLSLRPTGRDSYSETSIILSHLVSGLNEWSSV